MIDPQLGLAHLEPVRKAEFLRGNRVYGEELDFRGPRYWSEFKYPLDIEAIRAEFTLAPGHRICEEDGTWFVICDHARYSLFGRQGNRGWLAKRDLEAWWRKWERGPQTKTVV
jgi:hypothetical protein